MQRVRLPRTERWDLDSRASEAKGCNLNIINIVREYVWGEDDEREVGISSGDTLAVFVV